MSELNSKLENKLVTPIYHVDTVSNNEKFCKHSHKLISRLHNNDNWAGNGMYFWDNLDSAMYWYNIRKKFYAQYNIGPMSIVKAVLYIKCGKKGDLLDLTDRIHIHVFDKVFNEMINFTKKKDPSLFKEYNPKKYEDSIGGEINWLYYIGSIMKGKRPFNATRIAGIYPRLFDSGNHNFIKVKSERYAHITDKAKIIYAIHNPLNVIDRHLIIRRCNNEVFLRYFK